jgi:hypothetical protein
MRGSKDFPQDDWSGELERENFVKIVAIILLWIIFFFGAYSTISWCAGPELEDLFRGYDPLTGKQRRKRLRESKMPSINGFLKNKCLLVWRNFNLQWKRSKNHLWHICNLGSNWFSNSTSWKIYYWRLRSWKLNIQRLILKVQTKLEQVSSWTNSQLAVFSSARRKHWDSMGQGLIWAAYKGHLLEQRWKHRIRELEIQAAHTRSLWKSNWERTKHQLTQRLHNYLISLQTVRNRIYVGRQRSCLRLGGISSSQILSWMGNLHVAWSYNISYEEPPRSRAHLLGLWQYPKAPFSTADGIELWNDLDRRAATRRTRRVSGSSRLVLLFLCGLKLLHDAQRLRDPGQAMLRSQADIHWTSAIGSITKEPGWQMWCNKDDKGTDIGNVKHSEPIRQKESSMAETWKGRMSRMSVEGVVGFVMWDCAVVSVYGYVHPQSDVRKCSRIHRFPLTTVAFEGPIDKG